MVRHQTALKPRPKEQLHMFQHLIPHYHPRLPRNVRHTHCLRKARYSAFIVACGAGERFKSMSISRDLTPTPPKKITPRLLSTNRLMGKILHVFSWGGERFKSMSISGDLTPTPPKKIAPLAFFPPTVSWERSYMYFLEGENASNPWVFQEIWPLPPSKNYTSRLFSTNRLMGKILHVFSWGGERFKSMSISGDLTPTPLKKLHLSPSFHQPSKDPICIFLRGGTLQIHEYFRRSDPYSP